MPAGAYLGAMGGSWPWTDHVQFQENTHVYGEGFLNVVTPYNMPVEDPNAPPRLHVWTGKKAVIDVGIGTKNGTRDTVTFTDGTTAEIYLNGTNSLSGRLRLMGTGSTMARLIGNKNCTAAQTSIGRGDAIVYEPSWSGKTAKGSDNKIHISYITTNGAPQAKFYYSGTGETTDKDLVVSNTYTTARSVTLGNRGTGTLTWNGDALQIDGSPGTAFTLDAQTAPIVFGGLFEAGRNWTRAVAGSETVSFSQTQPAISGLVTLSGGVLEMPTFARLPNVTGFVFAGGGLRITESCTASVDATFQSGASSIELADGVELTLSSLTLPSGASLNVALPDGGTASVTVTGATPGPLPATVTWNGMRAKIDDQGRIQPSLSAWLSAQDGTWNTAAKWSNGVPGETDTALVNVAGPSYTVAIDEAPAHAISNLRIANAGAGVATVAATTDLDMGAAAVDLQLGGALAAGDGGTLNITNAAISFNGGSINGSGSGIVNVKDGFAFGSGTNTFTGTSRLMVGLPAKSSQRLYQNPTSDGPSVVTLSEQATYCLYQGFWVLCNNVPGGRAILNFDGTDGVSYLGGAATFYGMAVGCRQGYGEMNLKHGTLNPGNFGIFVAADSPDSASSTASTPHCVTGVVNQTGGNVSLSSWGWHYAGMVCGLVVGDGTRVPLSNPDMVSKSQCVGHYNLSGGKLEILRGACVVGVGVGTGTFNHSGGTYYHNATDTYQGTPGAFPLVIGMGLRGRGTWTMTGGTTDIRNHVYVGGAEREDLKHNPAPSANAFPDGDGCTGILDVSNGTFVTTKDLYVGAKGTGTLVLRPTGTIQAENVVLSNGVASVLRPVVEGTATGLLKATGDLVITDGARIEIDATGMSANAPLYTRLATAGNIVGAFDDGHVSFTYDESKAAMRAMFASAEIVYELDGEKGLWLKTTPRGTMVIFR